MDTPNITYILAYLKGELNDEERDMFENLMQSSPEFRNTVAQTATTYELTSNLQKQQRINTEAAWQRVSRRITNASLPVKIWDYVRTTAAVVLPLFLIYQFLIHPMRKPASPEMVTVTSAPGIVSKVVLPDGSEVWLNAQSELSYPTYFGKNKRDVRVRGEAYFKVSADKKNRFNVTIHDSLMVSAYGTAFNIKAYNDEPTYQVTLAEGNVDLLKTNGRAYKLVPNQKAVYDHRVGETQIEAANIYVETAWKDGMMVFRRETLDHIAQRLSRKFGVTVQVEDSLKKYEYTATFTDETLEDILNLLIKTAPITYSISERERKEDNTYSRRTVWINSK